ncbi:MAG: hypothetical protein U0792_12905 [Gemmataceae bacterium]
MPDDTLLTHNLLAAVGIGYVVAYLPRAVPRENPVSSIRKEMITFFQVNGAMIYVDPDGNVTGFDDVFTRIAKCRTHYADCGLGSEYINQFIQ